MNKILCSLAVLTALGVGAFAPVAHADILGVGLVDPSFSVWGPIYSIDSTTGTATVLNPGTTNQNNGYMDVTTASDGTIYATAQTPFFSEHDDLWTINPTTGATTNVGRITLEGGGDHDGNLKGLAFDPVSGGLYALGRPNTATNDASLYQLNKTTGALTLIGDTGLFDPNSLARSASGVYYTVDNSPTETNLYTLNVSTGAKTFVANLASSNGSTIDGLAFSPNGALWAIGAGDGGTNYWTIDQTTGAMTLKFSNAATDPLFGLTFVAPVPVPAAVWLFGTGVVGLVALARRKMNREA